MTTQRRAIWPPRNSRKERAAVLGIGLGTSGMIALAAGVGTASSPALHAPVAVPAARAVTVVQRPVRPESNAGQVAHDDAPAAAPLQRYTAPVGADLSQSLRDAGVPADLAYDYVRQMMTVAGFAEAISVADRFDLVVLRYPGERPTLVYAGMDRIGRGDLQFLKYGDGHGRVEWVDARGLERRESGGMMLPVGGRVTSGFGQRMHPLLGYTRFHRGIDLAAALGTPVRAAADGRVVGAGWHGGYGWQVKLDHGGGLDTSYGHLSRILARAGTSVRRGDVIGLAGSTGLSTGPHVHFEALRNGRAIDPRSARIDMPVAMNKEQRHAFDDQLRSVLMASSS